MRGRFIARVAPLAAAAIAAVSPGIAAGEGHDEGPGSAELAAYCSFERPAALFGAGNPLDSVLLAGRAGQREPSGMAATAPEEVPLDRQGKSGSGAIATIPVYFHVFTDGKTGNLSDAQIQNQIAVLNAGFSGREGGYSTGFSFVLAGVQRINDPDAFYKLDMNTTVERRAKAATHVGDASTLNVWTTNGPSYLGFATFPSSYRERPELDGIVLDYNSLKGGAYGRSYSLAKTGTHEVGHWLGLYHTFQGACNANGDYVADTPKMSIPTNGCPEGKDTCDAPGLDPIRNYMDYSFDSCYNQFTSGQGSRMRDQWLYYRAGGGTTVGS